MSQLILHLIGDYLTQSQWMADNKRRSSLAAGLHALCYSVPFLLLRPSLLAFAVICGTHFLIDRFGLARYVVWFKNVLLGPIFWKFLLSEPLCAGDAKLRFEELARWSWGACQSTGYPASVPPWLAVFLLIAADNTLHLIINYAALRWL